MSQDSGGGVRDEAGRLVGLLEGMRTGREGRLALAFSGGVDSSVLAAIFQDAALYTAGVEGAEDVNRAMDVASQMGRELHVIDIDEGVLEDAVPRLAMAARTDSPLIVSFELPFFLVCLQAAEPTVMAGQGADELFGGYSRYLKMSSGDAAREMEMDVQRLVEEGEPRERRLAAEAGKGLMLPYLRDGVVELALGMPIKYKIDYKNRARKLVLREAARVLGVPEAAAACEKKAAQYGSGVTKLLRKMGKKQGMASDDFIRWLCGQ